MKVTTIQRFYLRKRTMLIMRWGDKLLQPHLICSSCLLANHYGEPRWANGRLKCGRALNHPGKIPEFVCINGAEIIEVISEDTTNGEISRNSMIASDGLQLTPERLESCSSSCKQTELNSSGNRQNLSCGQLNQISDGETQKLPLTLTQPSKDQFREWAQQVGPQTTAQVQAIFESKAHEKQAFRSVKRLQRLAQQYGNSRLEAACLRVNVFGMVGLRRINTLLETGLDQVALPGSSI
jgi:hypothetical protein